MCSIFLFILDKLAKQLILQLSEQRRQEPLRLGLIYGSAFGLNCDHVSLTLMMMID